MILQGGYQPTGQGYGSQIAGYGTASQGIGSSTTLGVGDYQQQIGQGFAGVGFQSPSYITGQNIGQSYGGQVGGYLPTGQTGVMTNWLTPVNTQAWISPGVSTGQTFVPQIGAAYQQGYQAPITSAWQLQQQIQQFRNGLNNIEALVSRLAVSERSNVGQLQQLQQSEISATQQLQQLQQMMGSVNRDLQQLSGMAQQVSGQQFSTGVQPFASSVYGNQAFGARTF